MRRFGASKHEHAGSSSDDRFDSTEERLVRAVYLDSKADHVAQSTKHAETATKHLLHLCCDVDSALNEHDNSVNSPLHTAAHSVKRHACTADLWTTKDVVGHSQARVGRNWNPDDYTVEDLVMHKREKDLGRVVKLWSDNDAVQDCEAALTVNDYVLELRDSKSAVKDECLLREALALGRATTEAENLERRTVLGNFPAVYQCGGAGKEVSTSPLIRAAQGGDEAIIRLLLKTNIDVNDSDADGNSALHWILKLSRLLCPRQIRIVSLLLDHGARVSQRNNLGLTAFHIASGSGNSEALEVLLLKDPNGIHCRTEMKETPLFFAVKNNRKDCAQLLLNLGASTNIFNIRGQRAIDLATSQDMCHILLNPTIIRLINHPFPSQDNKALELPDDDINTESTKADVCKYVASDRKCVGGVKCSYTNCEEVSQMVEEETEQSPYPTSKQLKHGVCVRGLPPSVDSEFLGHFFEKVFGSVTDAIVIVSQTGKKIESRGFGFVSFREAKSVSAAVQAHFVNMRGKQVEIEKLDPRLNVAAELVRVLREHREQNKIFRYQLPLQRSNEKKLKGTTLLIWVLQEPRGTLAGFDSRETENKVVVDDRCEKYLIIRDGILALGAGTAYDCDNVMRHMKYNTSKAVLRHPEMIKKIAEVGARTFHRRNDKIDFTCFVMGMEHRNPVCYMIDAERGVRRVQRRSGSGSGLMSAYNIFIPDLNHNGHKRPIDEAVEVMERALLHAALLDSATGGILTVVYVNNNGLLRMSSNTVVELMLRHYSFYREDENKTIFLFHKHEDLQKVEDWILDRRNVEHGGHSLTRLEGGFTCRCILLDSREAATTWLQEAKRFTHLKPFIKQKLLRYLDVNESPPERKGKKILIFMAPLSAELLGSLVIPHRVKDPVIPLYGLN